MRRPGRSWLLLAVLAFGCPSRTDELPPRDAGIQPRVFSRPPSRVRAVPPHHVHEGGIGPYELATSLKKTLNTLPHGPRIELFRIGRLADFSLARAEDGGLLVGLERDVGVTFVAAVAAKIARTEAGVGVGSEVADATDELGPPLLFSDIAADPRLRRHRDLPGVAFIGDRSTTGSPVIRGIVVDRAAAEPRGTVAKKTGEAGEVADNKRQEAAKRCVVTSSLRKRALRSARLGEKADVAFLCRADRLVGAVAFGPRRLTWLSLDKGRIKRGGTAASKKLVFAAPIDLPDGGGEHVIAVSEDRNDRQLRIELGVFRVESGRVVPVASNRVYSLSRDEVTWVGGLLEAVEVIIEARVASPSELAITGLYVERRGERISMVAPLAAQKFNLKRRGVPVRKSSTFDAGVGGDGGPTSDADGGSGSDAAATSPEPAGGGEPKKKSDGKTAEKPAEELEIEAAKPKGEAAPETAPTTPKTRGR